MKRIKIKKTVLKQAVRDIVRLSDWQRKWNRLRRQAYQVSDRLGDAMFNAAQKYIKQAIRDSM